MGPAWPCGPSAQPCCSHLGRADSPVPCARQEEPSSVQTAPTRASSSPPGTGLCPLPLSAHSAVPFRAGKPVR